MAGLAIEHARGHVQTAALLLGLIGKQFDASGPDAPRGKVHHPQEGGVLVRILHEPQIGQCMLDLSPFKKPQAPKDTVGHARLKERLLHHPGLGVAAIEHRHLAAHHPLLNQATHLVDQPLGLEQIARGLHHPNGLTGTGFRPEVLAQAAGVVGNERIGGIQNVAV